MVRWAGGTDVARACDELFGSVPQGQLRARRPRPDDWLLWVQLQAEAGQKARLAALQSSVLAGAALCSFSGQQEDRARPRLSLRIPMVSGKARHVCGPVEIARWRLRVVWGQRLDPVPRSRGWRSGSLKPICPLAPSTPAVCRSIPPDRADSGS